MEYSVIVAFKNRDRQRVQFFLESLLWQNQKDFELIFVNQGSDDAVNEWLQPLLKKFPFARYIYNHTQGHLWNKSNALNIGIKASIGKYIIIADIDIIFPPNFLQIAGDHVSPKVFITHNAYYLPGNFKLKKLQDVFGPARSKICDEKFIGLCIAEKEAFIKIKGYDEYFLLWGAEDDDIILRMENAGKKRLHLPAKDVNIYHQWHASSSPLMSTWYVDMVNYAYLGKQIDETPGRPFGYCYKKTDRNIIEAINQKKNFTDIAFMAHPLFLYTFLIDGFHKMKPGELAKFELPVHQPPMKGRKQKVVDKLNALLLMSRLPYTLQNNKHPIPTISREMCFDFIAYFIGKNRSFIGDYYLFDNDMELKLYFQKK